MKVIFFMILGVISCSQFFLISCTEKEVEDLSLEAVTMNCDGQEPVEIRQMDNSNELKILFPEGCGNPNTNIPIKIIGDEALITTLNYEVLSFQPDEWNNSNSIEAKLLFKIPSSLASRLSDYYILGNSLLIMTMQEKNYLLKYDFETGAIDTLFSYRDYVWNSFPFFGTEVREYEDGKFYLPFTKYREDQKKSLFASFEFRDNKMSFKKQFGTLESELDGWTPFSNTPVFSNYINEGYWMCTTTSQGVVHYSVQSGELIQDNSICFPASSVKDFPKKFSYKKMEDQYFMGSTFITESYNLRILASASNVLKFVKRKHPYVNEETQMKYMMNDVNWFIDSYQLKTKKVIRYEFQAGAHYYTMAFLFKKYLLVARQDSEPGTIVFNQIEL